MAENRLAEVAGHWLPRMEVAGIPSATARAVLEEAGTWENWCRAWSAAGERHAAVAAEAESARRTVTAGEAWVRAALCHHFAQRRLLEPRVRPERLDVIAATYESESIRAFMLWMAFMTMEPPDQPGTGRLAYALVAGRQRFSWAIPRGGSIALPRALARVVEAHGGLIVINRHVDRLVLENDRCVGVACRDGSTYRARKAVLSSLHVKHLVGTAPEEAWPGAFAEGVRDWRGGVCMFAAHYAATKPLTFMTPDGPIQPSAAGIMPSALRALSLGTDIAAERLNTDAAPLLVICSTSADPSRAPPGHHTLKVVGFHPYRIAGDAGAWDRVKEDVADAHLDHLMALGPGLGRGDLLAHVVKSPLDLERRNPSNWERSCHGGAQDEAQSGERRPVRGYAQHRMPIRGLYQTGAVTHPGGSVSAGPGRNAAEVILHDLGLPLLASVDQRSAEAIVQRRSRESVRRVR